MDTCAALPTNSKLRVTNSFLVPTSEGLTDVGLRAVTCHTAPAAEQVQQHGAMKCTNPYAKKRNVSASNSDTASQSSTFPNGGPSTAALSASVKSTIALPAAVPKFAAFSQAFEYLDDTDHFQNEQRVLKGGSARSSEDDQDRAAQRALDKTTRTSVDDAVTTTAPTAANTAASLDPATDAFPGMSDRDHHVLMQQPHVLYVSVKQRGNGVLQYIRNVPWQFQKMVPDYIFSSTTCALFLSIRYHLLYKEYIDRRIAELRTDFTLRVLLVLVDVDDSQTVLLELNKLAVLHNLTLILAWTEEEAARYLETFKALHGKDASSIQKNKETGNFADQATDFLTTCKGVNKTDAASVLTQLGSIRQAMAATADNLGMISGLGEVKVKRLHDAFHKPFSSKAARLRKEKRLEQAPE
jgi:DNA excision repair protein ERCC-1